MDTDSLIHIKELFTMLKSERPHLAERAGSLDDAYEWIKKNCQHTQPAGGVVERLSDEFAKHRYKHQATFSKYASSHRMPDDVVAAKAAIAAMGDAPTETSQSESVNLTINPSEIPVNDIINAIDKAINGMHLDRTMAILNAIRPYLNAPKPVMVDLEKCARFLSEQFYKDHPNDFEHYRNSAQYAEHHWKDSVWRAKKFLDAMELAYVE